MGVDTAGWQVFPTVLGECGISWCEAGVDSFLLPDTTAAAMAAQLQRTTGRHAPAAALPPFVRSLIRQVQAHCRGELQDFRAARLFLGDATDFTRAVYEQARLIPAGCVITYAQLAERIGKPGAARAIGSALGKNRLPLLVPCHRIVAAGGKPGGFTSPGGLDTKRRLLACEGVALEKPRVLASAAEWRRALVQLQADPHFARLYRQVGDITFVPHRREDPLAAFIAAIVSQQLSTKVATVILQRVKALVSVRGKPSAKKMLATDDVELRAAGLSAMKVSYLKDLARHSLDGLLPARAAVEMMPDEEIIRRFTAVKGVGRWTVEMYLIFDLGRANVFPVDDYGIRKALARLHGMDELPAARTLMPYGENWQPYRSVASLYLWRSLDNT